MRGNPRYIAAGIMALSSSLLFIVLVFEDLGDLFDSWTDVPWAIVLRYVVSMALAGALAGLALSWLVGRGGLAGWIMTLGAGIVAATAAGVVGSFFAILPDLISRGPQQSDLISILAGALVLPFALAGWPLLIVVWLGLLGLAHLWCRRARLSGRG